LRKALPFTRSEPASKPRLSPSSVPWSTSQLSAQYLPRCR
jgi:hypothetical protein